MPFINNFIFPYIFASSRFDIIYILALIHAATDLLSSIAMFLPIFPFANIFITIFIILYSFSMRLPLLPIANINLARRMHQSSKPMRLILTPIPLIHTFISKQQFPFSLSLPIIKLPIIHGPIIHQHRPINNIFFIITGITILELSILIDKFTYWWLIKLLRFEVLLVYLGLELVLCVDGFAWLTGCSHFVMFFGYWMFWVIFDFIIIGSLDIYI